MRALDLINKDFGYWHVLHMVPKANSNGRKRRSYLCKCVCGTEKLVDGSSLTAGLSISCGCHRVKLLKARNRKPEGISARNNVYARYRKSAKDRCIDFVLTREDFYGLTQQLCHYCGELPSNEERTVTGSFIYNGIDRVNSLSGYTLENCVPCCWKCNRAKANLSYDEFISLIRAIHSHLNL